jgi:hypothetical protein
MQYYRQYINNFLACLVSRGYPFSKILIILIVNNYSITYYFNRKIFSFIKNDDIYDDLIVLLLIILTRIFIKAITKIRGSLRVAFLTKNSYFTNKQRYLLIINNKRSF